MYTHYTMVVPASQILQGHASMSIEKAGYNIIITQKKETGLASSAPQAHSCSFAFGHKLLQLQATAKERQKCTRDDLAINRSN